MQRGQALGTPADSHHHTTPLGATNMRRLDITIAICLVLGIFLQIGCTPSSVQSTPSQRVVLPPEWTATLSPTSLKPTETPLPTPIPTRVPAGRILAFKRNVTGQTQIFTVDLDYGALTQITQGSGDPGLFGWFPDGQKLMYSEYLGSTESVWVVDWQGDEPMSIASGGSQSFYLPILSPNGRTLAFFSTRDGHWGLYVMSSGGGPARALTGNTVFESRASWSPDGKRIVFTPWHNTQSPPFIGIADTLGSDYSELTSRDTWQSDPAWSPDGQAIVFRCDVNNIPQICTIKPDGSGRRQLTHGPGGNTDPVWSPDSQSIAFVSWRDSDHPSSCQDGECNFDIYVMRADGTQQTNLSKHPAEDWSPTWSPDGSTIAFVSLRDESAPPSVCGDSCNSEVYLMASDGTNVKRVTNDTGPSWSPIWRPPDQ